MIGGIRVASVHVRSGTRRYKKGKEREEGFFSRWWFEMYLMRAPRGSVPDIREVTAVGVGICGLSVVRVGQVEGRGGEMGRRKRVRETGGEGRGGSLRLCRAIWRYSGKGYKFHRQQIDKRLLYGSLHSFFAHLVAARTQSRGFLLASRLLFNCSRLTRADSSAGLNQYTNEESF